ncbi:MAG: hypothetical protein JNM34_10430, partial [Chthonomonadaceae bacterium]|nr:hypothetical protein [Chthonomonadaceae bacterium]
IYGGKVVNQREIAALEKDKSVALDKRAENDARILELWEEIPVAKVVAHTVLEDISKLKLAIAEKQRSAKAEHERLQSDFKAWAAKRPSAFKAVPARLVEQYEKLRVKLDVGMAMVTTDHRCGSCGMHVPEKAFEHISEDRVVQCENCRRILFRLQQG